MPNLRRAPALATTPSTRLVALLNTQIAMEFLNHNSYLALAAWCEDASLTGIGAYYRGQAYEEYMHAMLIYTWMLEWDLDVVMETVPGVVINTDSIISVTEQALRLENETTEAIHGIYGLAHDEQIWAIRDAFSWFVSEQVEELAAARENLARAQLAGAGGGAMLEFDREIGAKAAKALPLPAGAPTSTG